MVNAKNTNLVPQRRWPRIAAAAVLLIAFVWWMFGAAITGYTRTGASYMAHVACACHYIGGRDLTSCESDELAGMGPVSLSADEDEKSVTARYLIFARETATYKKGYGCVLEKWED